MANYQIWSGEEEQEGVEHPRESEEGTENQGNLVLDMDAREV